MTSKRWILILILFALKPMQIHHYDFVFCVGKEEAGLGGQALFGSPHHRWQSPLQVP
jgi:hypothetical protein